MLIDPSDMRGRDVYRLMTSIIAPRPIALASTVDEEGRPNLAPFSYFSGITSRPPLLSLCVGFRRVTSAEGRATVVPKDTARNALRTGELVVNVVTEAIAQAMNLTSAELPSGDSEFEYSGLTELASDVVAPPRVAESPVAAECRMYRHVDLGEARIHMLVAEVVRFHVADDLLGEDGLPDPARLQLVGRMGAAFYTRAASDLFSMPRPVYEGDDRP